MKMTRMTYHTAVVAMLLAVALPAAPCRGETASWLDGADVDAWVYLNTTASGHRERAPSFGGVAIDPQTMQFAYGSADGASRMGMAVMAFETNDLIEAGYSPSRYSVSSVKVTAWARRAAPVGTSLLYTNQPLTPTALLNEALGGSISSQKPMELFGVGFREGYDGFDLGITAGDLLFNEDSESYGGTGHSYVTYPIVIDAQGQNVDVSNNYTGGFSATAPGEFTAPFNVTPWSIGTTNAAVGAALPSNSEFTFNLDLAQPGVVDYVQKSLSQGVIGFMLSSMHSAGQEGSGGSAYPDWRMREGAVGTAFATLTVEYELLPLVGDYDGNGVVEQADYTVWSQTYGSTVTAGSGADGNSDGFIDAADYTVWRDALASSPLLAVPEPTALVIAIAAIANLSQLRRGRVL